MTDSNNIFEAPFEIFSEKEKFILKKTKNGEVYYLNKNLEFDCLKRQTCDFIGSDGVKAYSIVGVAEAKVNKYLIAATKSQFVGKILNSNIFKIEEVKEISNLLINKLFIYLRYLLFYYLEIFKVLKIVCLFSF